MNNLEPGNGCYALRHGVFTASTTAPIISRIPISAAPGASGASVHCASKRFCAWWRAVLVSLRASLLRISKWNRDFIVLNPILGSGRGTARVMPLQGIAQHPDESWWGSRANAILSQPHFYTAAISLE